MKGNPSDFRDNTLYLAHLFTHLGTSDYDNPKETVPELADILKDFLTMLSSPPLSADLENLKFLCRSIQVKIHESQMF